jgi:hypothetical protein
MKSKYKLMINDKKISKGLILTVFSLRTNYMETVGHQVRACGFSTKQKSTDKNLLLTGGP